MGQNRHHQIFLTYILTNNYGSQHPNATLQIIKSCKRNNKSIHVDPTLLMSKVVENYLQSTPPSTSVRPLRTIHKCMHKLGRKQI
jgi:adenylate cyclase